MSDKKFVLIITHSQDRPVLVSSALKLAVNMRAMDQKVDLYLIEQGVQLAKKGYAETIQWERKDRFSSISELIDTLSSDLGVKFYACEACSHYYGVDKEMLIDNAEIKTGAFLAELLVDRQGLTF